VVAASRASYRCRCVILLSVGEASSFSEMLFGVPVKGFEDDPPDFVGVWCVLPTTSFFGAEGMKGGYESESE